MDYNLFDESESLAVARLVWMLIFSDEVVDRRESDFFDQLLKNLKLTSETFETSLSQPEEWAYEVIRSMPAVKRRECGKVLRLAVGSNNKVDLSALSRLNEILENAAIFRPDKKTVKKSEEGFN